MTPAEILAAIAASPALQALAADRNDAAIAAALSVGRKRVDSLVLTERGVREHLSIIDGAQFLKTLRELSEATTAPAWLTTILGAMQVPSGDQWAYFDALQCGWPWLKAQGLDVGTTKVRSLLDLLAAGNSSLAGACATLKALAEQPDPVSVNSVSNALNGA